MAAFQERLGEIESTGARLVGLSVDHPETTEAFRKELGLGFTILSDADRTIVKSWDRFNRYEMGGIAKSTIFAIDSDLRVRFRADGKTESPYGVDELVTFLQSDSRFANFGKRMSGPFVIKVGRILGLDGYGTQVAPKPDQQKGSQDG